MTAQLGTRTATRRRELRDTVPERTGARWWLGQIAAWLLLLSVLSVAAVMVVLPRAAGATAYTVLTGSMTPGLPVGSLAVVRPVDPASLRLGDVVTFQQFSNQPSVVTHRIVEVGATLAGEPWVRTRGDANGSDDAPITAAQIRGRLWYSVPLLGHLNTALTGSQHVLLLSLSVTGLLGYAAVMTVGAFRERQGAASA